MDGYFESEFFIEKVMELINKVSSMKKNTKVNNDNLDFIDFKSESKMTATELLEKQNNEFK